MSWKYLYQLICPYTILHNNGHKLTWLLHLIIIHITCIANLLVLCPLIDSLGHPHVKGDMVHNSTHGLSIFDHVNLPITKHEKEKPSSHINDTTSYHIQCDRWCLLQINIISKLKPLIQTLLIYPSPMTGRGYNYGVGELNDAQTRSHTMHHEIAPFNYMPFQRYWPWTRL